MDKLLKQAIKIGEREEYIAPKSMTSLEDGNVIVFDWDNDLYVCRYSLSIVEVLLSEGFRWRNFYPFCSKENFEKLALSSFRMMEIPIRGINVDFCGFEERYYSLNSIENAKTFNMNNGRVLIVTAKKTFVAKDFKIIKILELAGYKRNSHLFVPFSNMERILDFLPACIWQSIPEE